MTDAARRRPPAASWSRRSSRKLDIGQGSAPGGGYIGAWERERARAFEPAPAHTPLFITLGRRRRDGSYTRPGGRVGQDVLADIVKRHGARVRSRRV